jgi:pyruvate/2-oxoglutarate/acetoin dehydrogenase E1 component
MEVGENMAVVKVSIKDNKTLELQEDASKGDIIDLSSLSSADVSSITEAQKVAAKKEHP